ncbi:hypothetical protein EIH07_04150 [Chryseobacterium taklimakanense]|uniref:hypothetical protein n=1 Tax=Chryseobacterium taklimakanense TaxID=536441 RepID=UPI000F5E980B|nr:hypothetical protein [Chryseobacterium taklimakanense]AZI22293.1 hypothetical protein EIH07_04150 [Chryseobacterium taklimakanense]
MENEYFKGETPEKGMGFICSLIGLLIFTVMGIGIDVDQYLQSTEKDIAIPQWYFFIIFMIDAVILLSILLIYFYRKAGAIIYPLATIAHFMVHMYFLDTFLYSDVTALFVFTGVALLAIIPKWQFFR